jgi:hypothetical protein
LRSRHVCHQRHNMRGVPERQALALLGDDHLHQLPSWRILFEHVVVHQLSGRPLHAQHGHSSDGRVHVRERTVVCDGHATVRLVPRRPPFSDGLLDVPRVPTFLRVGNRRSPFMLSVRGRPVRVQRELVCGLPRRHDSARHAWSDHVHQLLGGLLLHHHDFMRAVPRWSLHAGGWHSCARRVHVWWRRVVRVEHPAVRPLPCGSLLGYRVHHLRSVRAGLRDFDRRTRRVHGVHGGEVRARRYVLRGLPERHVLEQPDRHHGMQQLRGRLLLVKHHGVHGVPRRPLHAGRGHAYHQHVRVWWRRVVRIQHARLRPVCRRSLLARWVFHLHAMHSRLGHYNYRSGRMHFVRPRLCRRHGRSPCVHGVYGGQVRVGRAHVVRQLSERQVLEQPDGNHGVHQLSGG